MQNQISTLTRAVPKIINQRTHAVLDYTTAATLLAMGTRLRHRHPRASTFAFVNAAAVLMSSLLTDYPGGVFRTMSFKAHGAMDVAHTAMMAVGPSLLGFGRDPEAQLFYAQAAMEAGVVAATDWESSANSPASFA
jgi:hypothetical protein